MNIDILSMFPEIFDGFEKNPIIGRAVKSGAVNINYIDIKEHTNGCYRKLDDSPYGGAKGMILRVDAFCNALNTVKKKDSHVVLLSPKGCTYNQEKARELASFSNLVFVCGHYEGYDARIENYVDEMISVGDFILSGGENACAVVCDSIIRLLPGVLKNGVTEDDSFESGLLEHNQYTHPEEYDGCSVPSVLLSGNKAEIALFNKASSLMETAKHRPDLLFKKASLETIGKSTASVLMFDDFVMKVERSNFSNLERECDALNWMSLKTNVPKVYGFHKGKEYYLLMERINGKMLCDDYYLNRPQLLIKTAAEGLKKLWSIDVSGCPLNSSSEEKLEIAKYNIEHGIADFEENEDFKSREDLYQWLVDNKPEVDAVFSHGDYCLPNILVSKKGKISFIDLGLAGIGDRYCDIALCLRSIKTNLGNKDFDTDLFFEYLGIKPDFQKIKWYTLLDELF